MWPSIPSFRSFGNVACPSGPSCDLPYCIFSHDAAQIQASKTATTLTTTALTRPVTPLDNERAAKRLKLDSDGQEHVEQRSQTSIRTAEPQVFTGLLASKKASTERKEESKPTQQLEKPMVNGRNNEAIPRSATRPVSPPPKKMEPKAISTPEKEVTLVPRKLQKDPATFARRLTMLKALHKYMSPLNEKVARAVKPEIKALHLSTSQLNKLVVEEEEQIAKENAAVYENVVKQRLVALNKMTIEEWVKGRREASAHERGDPPKKTPPKKVSTGLTPKEEVTFLSALTAPEATLLAHGYVMKQPSEAELEQTQATQTSADFWEICDRCNTRFQVFPDRREEDGALTTGGKCQHHWGKRVFPKKVKGQTPEPTKFSCCNEPVGSPGCAVLDTHVYKVSDTKRMSLLMPFIETPENGSVGQDTAVCFDCEMGYTTHGLELLRLTAVDWPSHKPLIDVLVRPLGHVLDLNTQFSGVTAEQFLDAKPYDPENPKPIRKDLRIVDSPYVARDLFLAHVSPKTPVLGHALENDLNVIRLIHPTIVDTVILFPTKGGLPYRHGLRNLAKWHLDLDIQQAGAAGHDSYEDARTTGELIRFKVGEQWRKLKDEGWTIKSDGVYPPMPEGLPPSLAPPAPSMIGMPQSVKSEPHGTEKRKREDNDGSNSGNDEPPAKRQD